MSLQARILLGLLEKDFNDVSCSIQSLIEHIKNTGIDLPRVNRKLGSILKELENIGVLLITGDTKRDETQIVLQISQLTNTVHQQLFSDEVRNKLRDAKINIGIIPERHLFLGETDFADNRIIKLSEFVTKETLVQLQYCQEINREHVKAFSSSASSHSTTDSESFLFFPGLCTAEKEKIQWN